ncbi:hypothetical protein Nepgr_002347 [Nepenthes gracilis]|uniref:Uncharacterized protein n=1 Tax=Nepenthes gracilis TaxID=150966 RepID=A0AAD3P6S7_NEPGR|nr:hypothetical protein Nepgr_002347 [Nepenthes gracilis]
MPFILECLLGLSIALDYFIAVLRFGLMPKLDTFFNGVLVSDPALILLVLNVIFGHFQQINDSTSPIYMLLDDGFEFVIRIYLIGALERNFFSLRERESDLGYDEAGKPWKATDLNNVSAEEGRHVHYKHRYTSGPSWVQIMEKLDTGHCLLTTTYLLLES